MYQTFFIGSLVIITNMIIQVAAVVVLINYLLRKEEKFAKNINFLSNMSLVIFVLSILFVGHILQFSTWAWLFMVIGEFNDFSAAFYHSTVNFTSLGYGDIVMSEKWRLLGALEACNGILMFGLSTGTLIAIMTQLFRRADPRIQRAH